MAIFKTLTRRQVIKVVLEQIYMLIARWVECVSARLNTEQLHDFVETRFSTITELLAREALGEITVIKFPTHRKIKYIFRIPFFFTVRLTKEVHDTENSFTISLYGGIFPRQLELISTASGVQGSMNYRQMSFLDYGKFYDSGQKNFLTYAEWDELFGWIKRGQGIVTPSGWKSYPPNQQKMFINDGKVWSVMPNGAMFSKYIKDADGYYLMFRSMRGHEIVVLPEKS